MLPPNKIKAAAGKKELAAIGDQQQWSKDYAGSPMYKQRLLREENADGVTGQAAEQRASATQQQRQRNLNKGSVTVIPQVGATPGSVPGMTVGDPGRDRAATDLSANLRARPLATGNVFMERGYGQSSIPAHELSHQSTHGTQGLNANTYQRMARTASPAAGQYLGAPTEMKARMDAVRYQLKQRGIYDAGTEEFTPAHFQKALADPQISQDPQWQELGKTVGGDAGKLNWLMNNVAQNKPAATNTQMAKKGLKSVALPKAAKGLKDIFGGEDGAENTNAAIGAGAGLLSTGLSLAQGDRTDARGVAKGGSALGVLGSAASGAATGAQFGPLGAAIGGGLGLVTGIFQSSQQDKAREVALRAQKLNDQQQQWNRVGKDANLQPGQYKGGAKKVATKAIEIEGGEPHFSKKAGGQRTLKQYHPNGPKHSQGGIPTVAEEGDAIVTAKGAKGAQAVAAHQRGDHATVEKLINQMPEDKGSKKALGAARIKPRLPSRLPVKTASRLTYNLPTQSSIEQITNNAVGPLGISENSRDAIAKATVGPGFEARNPYLKLEGNMTSGPDAATKRLQNPATAVAQAMPSIYNLSQGLFGNVEKTVRRNYSPEQQQYQDLSGSQREASTQAMNQQVSNARNLSAGSAGNLRSNQNQAYADNVTRQNGIDAQESGRRLAIAGQNVESRNQAQAANIQMNDQADNLDLQNQAKKSEAMSKGLEGISGLASNSLLTKNTLAKESADRNMLGQAYKNFTYTSDQNIELRKQLSAAKVPGYKKGNRSIKLKGC